MNTRIKGLAIVYAIITFVAIVFMLNKFTDSVEINYVFRIVSAIIFIYIGTFPLVIATTTDELYEVDTKMRVLLYIAYLGIEAGLLIYAYNLFGNKAFMFNKEIPYDSFINVQENLTSTLWICMLISVIGFLVVLSIKLWFKWNDWTLILLVPFTPLLIGVAIIYVILVLCKMLLVLILSFGDNDNVIRVRRGDEISIEIIDDEDD